MAKPQEMTKNIDSMKELDAASFHSLLQNVREARKVCDQLLEQLREKKEAFVQEAKRLAEEQELLALAAQRSEPVADNEPDVQPADVAESVTPEETEVSEAVADADESTEESQEVTPAVIDEPQPVEDMAPVAMPTTEPQEAEQPKKAVQSKTDATTVEKKAPTNEKKEAPTIFVPSNSTMKKDEKPVKDISAYRAQNVQEPRKFIPPAANKSRNDTRSATPSGGARPSNGRPQSPAAGTTFVPPASTRNNRGNNNKKGYDRDYDDKKSGGRRNRRELIEDVSEAELNRRSKSRKGVKQTEVAQTVRIDHAVVSVDPVPIKLLAEKIGHPATEIVKKLLTMGNFKNVNDSIPFEDAELMAIDFGVELELKLEETMEDKLTTYIEQTRANDDTQLTKRAPVVTIMGHVDHGKTSLLDYIRNANVAQGEAGGITQHIGAYTIRLRGEKITFIDTPGHEAFTTMRARGAMVTDIAVIVVAADDSIMPQTVESINHAKAAKVPIIVAINKIDKPGANIDRVKNDLTKYDILISEWGGETECVPVSAKTGEGVDELLEKILMLADLYELKANPKAPASGTIIEARLDKNVGPLATILVQNGTLKVGDNVVAGSVIGKIKLMMDDKGTGIKQAGPSIPVSVLGFDTVPNAGDQCVVVEEKFAKQIAEERKVKERIDRLNRAGSNLEDLFKEMTEGKMKELNLIVKADVQGSVEAVCQELKKLTNDEVKVSIIHSGVGAVNESDVVLAATSRAVIVAFNVRPDNNAKLAAAKEQVDIRMYRVIYDAIDEIKLALKGMLAPKFKESLRGHCEVRNVFHISSVGTIAGCYVTDGKIERNAGVRLLRDNVVVYEGKIASLRRMKDDVKEVQSGFECGVGLEKYNDVKLGDVIECFVMEQVDA